jgi:hypothetical protein
MKNLKEFQKGIEKEFNLSEVITLIGNIKKAYGYGYDLSSAVASILYTDLKELDLLDKAIISKSAYVKLMVYADDNGFGNYGTPKKQYTEEYQEMVDNEEFETLIKLNLSDYNKKLKKITNLIIKKIGKVEASKMAFKKIYYNVNSVYDGCGIIQDFASSKLRSIWDNESDIYKVLHNRKDAKDSTLYSYIKNI